MGVATDDALPAPRFDRDRERQFGLIDDLLDQFLAAGLRQLPRQQPLLRQHHHAVQRGPDFQRTALAQKSDRRCFQRVHQQHEEHAVELYRSVNIEGTLELARSAAAAGVGQFIFVSTVLVHGRSNDGRAPFRESDVLTPRGLYGMSKAAAETGLRDLAPSGAMGVTVVRPPLVYGAGAKGNFSLLEKAVTRGIPLPFAAIQNRRAFLSVGNLTSFILHRLSHPSGKFDIFLVADEEQVSTPEFIERLARAAHTSPRLFRLPVPLLAALLKLSGRKEANDSLLGSLELDVSKALATGWRPQITLDEGLQQALRPPGS